VEITRHAAISEVIKRIGSSVLLGYDVLAVKRGDHMGFRKVAILAQALGPLPHRILGLIVHPRNLGCAVSF
jgi:hypothetical protein